MKQITNILQFYLNNLWRWKCGFSENEPNKPITFDELRQTEWNVDFEKLMRNRLIMGAMRYGRIQARNKPKYDRVNSMYQLTQMQLNNHKVSKQHKSKGMNALYDVMLF